MAKYKMTLFARFFIFLIIVIPVAYVLAAYINGQDGIEKLMALFSNTEEDTTEIATTPPSATPDTTKVLVSNKDELIQQKNDSIRLLQQQLEDCREADSQ